MSARVWPVVANREVVVKLRDRNFIVGTLITLALIAGGLALQVFLGGRTSTITAVAAGQDSRQVMQQVQQLSAARGEPFTLTVTDAASTEAATTTVNDEQADVALVQGPQGWSLVGKTGVNATLEAYTQEAASALVLERNAEAAGTTASALTAGSTVQQQLLDPDSNPGLKYVVGFVFVFLFYMASLLFGMGIAQSVVEEKQSRVVEILVSAVPVRQLLIGKVVGNTILALAQMVLFVGVGLIGLAFTEYASSIGLVAASAGWFVVFFVAGFVALACLWAVAGSLATRQEDLQSTTNVLTMLLVVTMFVGLIAEGTARVVASYVPVVSTIAMPQRLLAGEAAWWEPIVSLVVTLAFAAVATLVGERLYRRSILQTGRRMSYREAMRASA